MRKLTLTEAQAKEIAAHAGRCMTAVNQVMHAGCGITLARYLVSEGRATRARGARVDLRDVATGVYTAARFAGIAARTLEQNGAMGENARLARLVAEDAKSLNLALARRRLGPGEIPKLRERLDRIDGRLNLLLTKTQSACTSPLKGARKPRSAKEKK
jgi:hypothetical protein